MQWAWLWCSVVHFLTSPEKTIEFWPELFFFLQYLDGIQLPCLAGLSNQKSFFFFFLSRQFYVQFHPLEFKWNILLLMQMLLNAIES